MKIACLRRGIVALALKDVKSWSTHALILAFLALACLLTSSCGPRYCHSGIDLVNFDVSDPGHPPGSEDISKQPEPGVSFRNVYLNHGRLGPISKIRAFGFNNAVLYAAAPPHSISVFNARVGGQLDRAEAMLMPSSGTRTDLVLAECVKDALAANAQGQTSTIQIYSDGGIEDQSVAVVASIRESVEKLSTAKHFKGLALIGCLPEHRRQWEEWLTPLGDRAIVAGRTDGDQLLDRLAVRMEANR